VRCKDCCRFGRHGGLRHGLRPLIFGSTVRTPFVVYWEGFPFLFLSFFEVLLPHIVQVQQHIVRTLKNTHSYELLNNWPKNEILETSGLNMIAHLKAPSRAVEMT
jgi:hypothetical protein